MAQFINVVGIRCHPDDDARFNKWYNEVHIPSLMKIKSVKKVTRYKIASEAKEYPTYLTILEYDNKAGFDAYEKSVEAAAARIRIAEDWKARPYEKPWRVQYEEIKTWKK